MQEHQAIRRKLMERYAEIEARLKKITDDSRHMDEPLAADFAEQAVERENEEVLGALDNSIRDEMERIQRTLSRIDAGEYGVCEDCDQPIPVKRLEALPNTTRCIACEGKRAGTGTPESIL